MSKKEERTGIPLKKKLIAAILSFTLAAALTAGCGKTDTKDVQGTEMTEAADGKEENKSGTVELTVWAEESEWDMLQSMVDSFQEQEAKGTTIKVNFVQNSSDETKDNLLSDVLNGADIFTLADDQLSSMVAAGALAPVGDQEKVKSENLEDAVAAATINDTLYAYPMTADNGYFMYYDKNYFSDEDVATLDGMLAIAQAAGKQIAMDWTSGWYLYSFFGNTGMDFGINDDGVTNHCSWNATDGAVKGVDVAQAMLNIAANPAFANVSDTDFIAGAKDGSIIAGVSGVWDATEIKNAWGDNYGAVKLPTYTVGDQQVQMASFKGYKMLGVNYYSKNKKWALKLADWFTNEENQTIRLQEKNQGPSNANAASSEEVQKVPAIQAVLAQSEFGVLQRVGNSYWSAMSDFGSTMASGNPGGLELQDIMDTLVDGITQSTVK